MVRLIRELDDGHCTIGKIFLPEGEVFFTLERPWIDNQVGVSCIPKPGTYHVKWRQRPNGVWTYWLSDVPGRTYILIHSGNVVRHVQGCILLGMGRGFMKGERAVFQSVTAVRLFEKIMRKEPFLLEVA